VVFSRAVGAFNLEGSQLTDRGDFFSLMFFILALANLMAYGIFGWASNVQAQKILKYYRSELFSNIMRQHMSFFDDPRHNTGALVSRLSTEPQNIMELLSMNIGMVLVNTINVISSCTLSITMGWKLGLVFTFGALPLLLLAGYLRIRFETELDAYNGVRFAESSGLDTEVTMAIRTVASLALERQIIEKYEASLKGIVEKSIKALGWNMLWYSLSQSISFLAMALGFWYARVTLPRVVCVYSPE
jgi:ATP-binding cassette subfamily B (MDR/TAP) protein 1